MDDHSKSLLTWAAANSNPNIAPQRPFLQPNEIDQKWKEAILGGDSEVTCMKRLITSLSEDNITVEERLSRLEEIECYCELTHNANDFYKIGGLPVIMEHVVHSNAEIRCQALAVLNISLPNNIEFQGALMKENCLPTVMKLFTTDSDGRVRTKALLTISSLIRGLPEAIQLFLKADGTTSIIKSLNHRLFDSRLQRRAVFLLDYLFKKDPNARSIFENAGGLSVFAKLLLTDDTDLIEKVVNSLLSFFKSPSSGSLDFSIGSEKRVLLTNLTTAKRNEIQFRNENNIDDVAVEDDIVIRIDKLVEILSSA